MTTEIKVGDVIKSLDFPGTEDCYMIGKVVAILDDGDLYNCKAIVRVWGGNAEIVSNIHDFSVPRIGLHIMDDQYSNRLTVIA